MRLVYSLVIHALRPIAFAVLLWRGIKDRAYWIGLRERFGFGAPLGVESPFWVHAVSLGEITAAAPLIRALRERHSNIPLLVTTATPTGRARALALFGNGVTIRFIPYDTAGSMRRFLLRSRPRLALIMETELWPNLFHECHCRHIPIVLANARLSTKSVARYRLFGGLFRDALAGNVSIAAQSAQDAEKFVAIGARTDHTRVIGNLKFDVAVDEAAARRGRELRQALGADRAVWIAGSTHQGEEELVLTAHSLLQPDVRNPLLLLVPRHPERFRDVADLLKRRGFHFETRSSGGTPTTAHSVLLVDSVGELASLYAAADVAFVGGSLVPVGGHNLLEPAALGVPAVTGPFQSNARGVAELLIRAGAVVQASDAAEIAAALRQLLVDQDKRGRASASGLRAVAENRGSLARLIALIEQVLPARAAGR